MATRFDLTDMQLMVNVAGAQSLTRGAERTFLSLPAASNRVKSLEEAMGTELLYRGSQGVTLTPSGEVFVKHARTVLLQLELDRALLQVKELDRLGQSLAHRQQELMDSQRYRVQGLLPPGPQHP